MGSHEDELTARIIAGYERIPAGEPDEWGSLEELADLATAETLAKLDAEEEREGFTWPEAPSPSGGRSRPR